jgi:excisionase family DNA binding protein
VDPVSEETTIKRLVSTTVDAYRDFEAQRKGVKPVIREKIFTTGEVAKLCRISPRTVCKLFDQGKLGGYRVPGSRDRRIPGRALQKFCNDYGLPTEGIQFYEEGE